MQPAVLTAKSIIPFTYPGHLTVAIILPVYNENATIHKTLHELITAGCRQKNLRSFNIIVVNDGSTDGTTSTAKLAWEKLPNQNFSATLSLVHLLANQGHQRAIMAGIRASQSIQADAFVVMDADGQDDPQAILQMLEKLNHFDVVFARRSKRSESSIWQIGYKVYQYAFKIFLGQTLYFGNYCAFNKNVRDYLLSQGSFTHLAAALLVSPFANTLVNVDRRGRSAGKTKMSYLKLIDYGVAAMTSSSGAWLRLFTRLALATGFASFLMAIAVVVIKLFTDLAISGWASTITLITLSIAFQSIGFVVLTAFLGRVLSQINPPNIPSRQEVLSKEVRSS